MTVRDLKNLLASCHDEYPVYGLDEMGAEVLVTGVRKEGDCVVLKLGL